MFRTSGACLALLAATVVLGACGSSDKTPAAPGTTTAPAAVPAATSVAAPTSAAVQSGSSGDACTEVQYEIDLAHQLQQGKEPADPQAAITRLTAFAHSAPTEILANYAQAETVIWGHIDHRGADQINSDAINAILDKLTQWKSSHC
ncbi:hypothetical protein ACFXHA_04345 [Nocardia sp. NPDC059240]|uniref:hypothetical protein n=1 Tax=Nocardia sp. NPDC059240 TaxID=3346786 RepID=UPI0036CE6F29